MEACFRQEINITILKERTIAGYTVEISKKKKEKKNYPASNFAFKRRLIAVQTQPRSLS